MIWPRPQSHIATGDLEDAAVTAPKIAPDAVETTKIDDTAVTTPKLGLPFIVKALDSNATDGSNVYTPSSGDAMDVSNTTSIKNIAQRAASADDGRRILLKFTGSTQINHHDSGTGNIRLQGGADVTFAAGEVEEFVSDGTLWWQVGTNASPPMAVYNQTIKDSAGSPATQRSVLKFTGTGVTVADVSSETVVDIAPPYRAIQDSGSDQTQRDKINFVGATITDSASPSRTNVDVTPPNGSITGAKIAPATIKGSRTITIEDPSGAENIGIFISEQAITITRVRSFIRGATSVDFQITHGADPSSGVDLFTADKTADTTTSVASFTATFNDATIAAGEAVWIRTTALVGTPTQLTVSIEYTIDQT